MIDSHAHLIWDSFQEDIEDIVKRAENVGINSFIHPCVHTKDLQKMKKRQKRLQGKL